MEREPIQLKTRTKLTAHLYGSNAQAGSKWSLSRAPSARSPTVLINHKVEGEHRSSTSLQLPAVQSSQNCSRPSTADSRSSWVIIENPPNSTPIAAADSRPPSQPKSYVYDGGSPLPDGSRAKSALIASRVPTPATVRQSPSARSPSAVSAGDDVSLPPTRSNTAASQQSNSRPHSRMDRDSQAHDQSAMESRQMSAMSQNNAQTFEAVTGSPH